MFALTDRVALVTGGSRGLGRHIALCLAAAGADVLLTFNRQGAEAAEVVAEIEALGRRARAVQADFSAPGAVGALVEAVEGALADWGAGLDILIHNAGVDSHVPLQAVTEEALERQWAVNYKAPFLLTQALLPRMRDGGRVLAIGSGTTRFTLPTLVGYAPIKAAVEVFMRHVAKIAGARGITANAVSPGALETDFTAPTFAAMPQMRGVIAQNTALGRVGEVEDVGGVVVFLCSEAGRWVTGQRIEVSGGMFL
ncbi:MAG: SDR family oxidoreductase [Alphaproteobacteria bacterium]|nr:SDR family oxidoreductase [Alphaproteobacteria bacterium]